MNKKGFTLVELLAVIIILAIILAIAIPNITGIINSSYAKAYDADLEMMKRSAITYVGTGKEPLSQEDTNVITLSKLVNEKLISQIKDPKDESVICDGYVLVNMVDKTYYYKPYLKCGDNYESENYGTVTFDTTPPVITIIGDTDKTITLGDVYTDEGATALDDIDGDVTDNIIITFNVDPNVVGTYTVTYEVSDKAGNTATATRTVNVVDMTGPTISIEPNGNNTYAKSYNPTIVVDDPSGIDDTSLMYQWLTSTDEPTEASFSQPFTNNTSLSTTDNITGIYYLWILAKDNNGNTTISRSEPFNMDNTAPVITRLGNSPVNVSVGNSYTDAGATATDNIDGNITANIITTGSVNTTVAGTYTITYNVSDSAGNAATPVTRTVYVVQPPLASVIAPYLSAKNNSNYYIGSGPNNWLEFGQVSSSNTTPIMWRIIKSDSSGIQIIYEGTKNGSSAPTADGKIGAGAWDTTTTNTWDRPATIRTTLNNWYNNTFYDTNKNGYVLPTKWCIGGIPENNYYLNNVTLYSTLECTLDKTAADSPIGFVRASDILSVTSSGNYLGKSSYQYWSITAKSNTGSQSWIVRSGGVLALDYVNTTTNYIRPVLNLKTNVIYNGGTGTLADPYKMIPDVRPVITLSGKSSVTIGVGDTYSDAGATAIDDIDSTITSNITTTSTINPNSIGTYTVTYNVTDTSGNVADAVVRTVNVITPNLATKIAPSLVTTNGSNYFVGANPNNWIEFGQVSSSNTTPIMWRIFKSDDEGIKIIYEGNKNGTSQPTANGSLGVVNWDNYGSYGDNKWERPAYLKTYLNTWYNNLYVINKTDFVQPIQWCISGPEHESSLANPIPKISQFAALACVTRTGSGGYTFTGKTAASTPIGLIQAIDYLSTTTNTANCKTSGATGCATNNYLNKGYYYSTQNVDPYNSYDVWTVGSNGSLNQGSANYGLTQARPVINLKTNTPFVSGSGTLADPYKIQ